MYTYAIFKIDRKELLEEISGTNEKIVFPKINCVVYLTSLEKEIIKETKLQKVIRIPSMIEKFYIIEGYCIKKNTNINKCDIEIMILNHRSNITIPLIYAVYEDI